MSRIAILLLVVAALSGCRYYVAGFSADYSVVFTGEGDVDLATGMSTFTLTVDGRNIQCKGASKPSLKTGNIIGDQAAATLTCTDGRNGSGVLVVTSLEGGTGSGSDDCGNQYQMVWSTSARTVEQQLAAFRSRARTVSASDRCESSTPIIPVHSDPLA